MGHESGNRKTQICLTATFLAYHNALQQMDNAKLLHPLPHLPKFSDLPKNMLFFSIAKAQLFHFFFCSAFALLLVAIDQADAFAQAPESPELLVADLGKEIKLELLHIPPGNFMMGSTPEEKAWATGIEGGAQPGTERESYEGEMPRKMTVPHEFWMGRTEVTIAQFRQFVDATGYVTDAEKPGGHTQCFNPKWTSYNFRTSVVHPWDPMPGKSWRDPNFQFILQDEYPVVCVSWTDAKAFATWLNQQSKHKASIPAGYEFRLPTEAEWEYACRGGRKDSTAFWWGDDLAAGEGRLNISAVDFLPDREQKWPLASAPWSDGYAFVSPVDHFGELGRNGFGLADMCGNVWEVVLDHFDPKGGHEQLFTTPENYRPVCKGGNYFDIPGNARCAVRLGLAGPHYSDSRDGFRICFGPIITAKP
jgi:formylglycine-generating enzyme required for sulfatase activity